ncbi:unnamed protein product [Prunus armeniaca]
MGKKTKKTKKPGKGKEKAAKAEEKRARRETSSSHLRMTSMPSRVMDHLRTAEIVCGSFKQCWKKMGLGGRLGARRPIFRNRCL